MATPDLRGVRAVVDVQHIYRDGINRNDRGTRYQLPSGAAVWEADCALHYAMVLVAALESWGAKTWTNDPKSHLLVGHYSDRQRCAAALGANLYLACHLNAGGGRYACVEYLTGIHDQESAALAAAVTSELDASFPEVVGVLNRRLVRGDRGAVCVEAFDRGPAVLLEPLFGDQPQHQRLLSLAGLELVGSAIARGIAAWWVKSPATAAPLAA